MMGRFVLVGAIAALLLSAASAAAAPPDEVLLSIRGIVQTKPPVPFTHGEHWKTIDGCGTCHHRDGAVVGQKCSGCHGGSEEITKVCLRQAYHRQCVGCHSKGKRGPRKCNECHTGEMPSLADSGQ